MKELILGAIYGDIMGSVYEFHNWKHMTRREQEEAEKGEKNTFTDDTIMTIASMQALIDYKKNGIPLETAFKNNYLEFGRKYPSSYGNSFIRWLYSDNPQPYYSYGNGSAMRVSPCAWLGMTLEEAKEFARASAMPTHNHREGIKGAECTAEVIWLAIHRYPKTDILKAATQYYDMNFNINAIKMFYRFNETCQGTVPVAIKCFLEANSFDEAMDKVIKVGGDTDTMGAITMAIAEPYFRGEDSMSQKEKQYVIDKIPKEFIGVLNEFDSLWESEYQKFLHRPLN